MTQSPGSILGLAGTKTRLTPLPIRTVGVRGAARFRQTAGVPPSTQLGVMQATCAEAGADAAVAAAAMKRSP
jgi:hypothetical protein